MKARVIFLLAALAAILMLTGCAMLDKITGGIYPCKPQHFKVVGLCGSWAMYKIEEVSERKREATDPIAVYGSCEGKNRICVAYGYEVYTKEVEKFPKGCVYIGPLDACVSFTVCPGGHQYKRRN